MKKLEYLVRVIFLLLFSFVAICPISVYAKDAETLGDLRREYESVLAEKKAYDKKSEQAKQEIKAKEAAIESSKAELSKAEKDEEDAQLKIVESNEKIEANKLESEKVLTYMQQLKSSNAYMEYITGSSSMTELVTRIEAVKQITDYIQVVLDTLEDEIEQNEALKVELQEKQVTLSNTIASYQTKVKQLYANAEEYDEFSLSLDTKLETAKENYEVSRDTCIKKLGSANVNDNTKLSSCSDMPINGAWMNPLVKGVVTSPMGYRTHPVTGKVYSFHNAIDIGVSEGTPVYAAAAGKVVAKVNRSSCGGNMLFVDVTVNGKNYTTYYYHLLRFNVNVGDIVTQNSIIGYVGGYSTSKSHGGYDGCTTGAHLHYGVQNGWYSTSKGVVRSNVIVPPGFKNSVGYRFTSRTDMYWG